MSSSSSSSSSKRLPTLREWDDKYNISGLRKNDEEAARKNREEAKKDVELQARVDKVMERLRAMIEVKKNESAAEVGEIDGAEKNEDVQVEAPQDE